MSTTGIKVTATQIANYYGESADETLADEPENATGILWDGGTTACNTMLAASVILGQVGGPSEGDPGLEGEWLTTTPGRCSEHEAEDEANAYNDFYRPGACGLEA
ncbi:hypothetical protein [Candidatus Neomicrothrix sp.]|uniref:hypothetical protein n=1 Tax=Candidatus Neomicrothrix sp. TaxID=2719034 RepID=UPI001B45E494|nr:hypothetical protein [Candidatus Microthrix sp.]MBP7988829.1 hypothetical protein [Candidatus Microthrix sp.]